MIDGILNVYKETGYTSHDVVAKLRGILKQKKIGHTGTLDPDAEGVLPVCLGKGTKLCDMLTDRDKIYEAQLILGVTTDTLDMSGKVLSVCTVTASDAEITSAVQSFTGGYDQIPPMYSALKVNGRKLCDLARAGIEVERQPRRVEIYDIRVEDIQDTATGCIRVMMTVHCSKGTYIRSLCDDIGRKLGCGGAMGRLVRTAAAGFTADSALRLGEIEALVKEDALLKHVKPVEEAFCQLPGVYLKESGSRFLYNGNPFGMDSVQKLAGTPADGENVRVYDHSGNFLAVYKYNEANRSFKTVKMFL